MRRHLLDHVSIPHSIDKRVTVDIFIYISLVCSFRLSPSNLIIVLYLFQHATLLLDRSLENRKWELVRDLVRFLKAIGKSALQFYTPLYNLVLLEVHFQTAENNLNRICLDYFLTKQVQLY